MADAVVGSDLQNRVNSISNHPGKKDTSKKYWTHASYDERYQRAIDAGLSEHSAKEYANAAYYEVENSGWDNTGRAFGGKGSKQLSLEANESIDAELWRSLNDRQATEEYTDPKEEIKRRQNAGLNDAITGGSEIGTGETSDAVQESENTASLNAAINSESRSKPLEVATSIMTNLAGVMNMINGGIDLSSAIFDLNTKQANTVFDTIGKISDLGDYFPLLGYQFNPETGTLYEGFEDDPSAAMNLTIDPSFLSGMPFSDFSKRVSDNTDIKDRRVLKALYRSYKGMASPKAVNAYFDSYKNNIKSQNDIFDASVAGVGRTGSFTKGYRSYKEHPYEDPLWMMDNKYNKDPDSNVINTVVDVASDLYLYGLQASMSTNKNQYTENLINEKIFNTVSGLITKLQAESKLHDSPLANYLLVNMMSGSFNGIGEASLYFQDAPDLKQKGSLWRSIKDWSTLGFGAAVKGLQSFGMPFMLKGMPSKSISESTVHSFVHK